MAIQTITTERDFERQHYKNAVNATVEKPRHTIDPRLREKFELMQPLVLTYDGVSVLERGTFTGFPNVTLSHYALGKFLKDQNVRPESIADLGAGAGFNGNYASVHLATREIFFADLYPQAIKHSLAAYQLNHGINPQQSPWEEHQFGVRVETGLHCLDLRMGDASQTMDGAKFEVAVAAPMFVPGVCEVFPQAYQIFENIAKKAGAQMFFGHSNLAQEQVSAAARMSGRKIDTHIIATVPLRLEYSDGTRTSNLQRDTRKLIPEVKEHLTRLGLETLGEPNSPEYYHKLAVSHIHD